MPVARIFIICRRCKVTHFFATSAQIRRVCRPEPPHRTDFTGAMHAGAWHAHRTAAAALLRHRGAGGWPRRPSRGAGKAFSICREGLRAEKRLRSFPKTSAVVSANERSRFPAQPRLCLPPVQAQQAARAAAAAPPWQTGAGDACCAVRLAAVAGQPAGGLQQGRRAIRSAAGVEESGGKGPNIGKCKGNEGKIKKNGVMFCYEPQKCYLCSAKPRNPSGRRPAAEYSDGRLLKTTCMKSFYNTYYFFYFYFSTK